MSASAREVLSLYRAFLREARKFPNYNVREYVKRRSGLGFRELQHSTDQGQVAAGLKFAKEQLQVVRRQAIIYSLYGRPYKNILELGGEA